MKATTPFKAIKRGDISFSVGDQFRVVDEAADEGWLKVESVIDSSIMGQVPMNYVEEVFRPPSIKLDKASLRIRNKASIVEDLCAKGIIPSGHRLSTLAVEEDKRTLSDVLSPKISANGLQFEGLATGAEDNDQMRHLFSILGASSIPMPANNNEIEVVEHQARLVIFNGEQYLSNIQTLRSVPKLAQNNNDLEPGVTVTTHFDFSKASSSIPGWDNNDHVCLLGYNYPTRPMWLLAELAYVAKVTGKEDLTISCGWTQIPLGGRPGDIEMLLHGGTHFESGVNIETLRPDAVVLKRSLRTSVGLRRSAQAAPMLKLKIISVPGTLIRFTKALPVNIICQEPSITLLAAYMQSLANRVLEDRSGNMQPLFDPISSCFLNACENNIILRALRNNFKTSVANLPRKERKDFNCILSVYEQLMKTRGLRVVNDLNLFILGETNKSSNGDKKNPKKIEAEATYYAKVVKLFLGPIEIVQQGLCIPFSVAQLRVDIAHSNLRY